MNITEPLRLTTGSHTAGSGKGCAMNVVSWENGDVEITDFPACSDRMLARIVQRVNDTICDHTDWGVLCPACALVVLDLGHRTVGSGDALGLSDDERYRVWVRVAAYVARQVVHLAPRTEALAAIEAAEGWCDGTVSAGAAGDAAAAADAAYAAGAAYAAYASDAAIAAAYAAAFAGAAYAADAAAYASDAAAYAADAAARIAADSGVADMASPAINKFWELVGSQPTIPSTATIDQALRDMSKVGA